MIKRNFVDRTKETILPLYKSLVPIPNRNSTPSAGWYNFRNGGTERLRLVPDFTRIW